MECPKWASPVALHSLGADANMDAMVRLWIRIKRHVTRFAIVLAVGFLGVQQAPAQANPNGSDMLQVERDYDRFQRLTTFSLETDLPEAKACDDSRISSAALRTIHVCKGDVQSCQAIYIALTFRFITSEWTFQDARITLLVDGARVPLPSAKWDGAVLSAGSLRESIGPIVPATTFRKMANAKLIEVQIGSCEFAMNAGTVASFRAISKKIDAAPKPLTSPKAEPKGSTSKKATHQI